MESVAFKCPNCNADIKFSAADQKFSCEYCGSSFTEQEMKEIAASIEQQVANRPEEEVQTDSEFEEQTNIYHCDSCGAEIMADENTAATFCYYCHNPVVLAGRVSGDFRPKYVLPFQIDRKTAIGHFQDWCKKHWFLPKDFLDAGQQEKIVGLYVPFWVTDVNVNAEMDALGKNVRTWTSGSYQYTETKEFAVARKANVVLKGLPADGASHIDDDLMEAVEIRSGFFRDVPAHPEASRAGKRSARPRLHDALFQHFGHALGYQGHEHQLGLYAPAGLVHDIQIRRQDL